MDGRLGRDDISLHGKAGRLMEELVHRYGLEDWWENELYVAGCDSVVLALKNVFITT